MNLRRGAVAINVIIILIVAVFMSMLLGSYIAQGSFLEAYLILIVTVGLVLLNTLRSKFWILIPLTMTSDLPAISIFVASLKLGELWILASLVFVALYWVAERKKISLLLPGGLPMYAYAGWAVVIFFLNPVGLLMAGGTTGGGRDYLTVGLAFIAFFIIGNVEINEKDSRRLIIYLIIGVLLETAFKLLGAFVPEISYLTASRGMGTEGFYSWAQLLALPPAFIVPLIFARYSLTDLIHPKQFKILVILLVLYVMVLVSGKRSLAVLVLAYPAFAALIKREYLSAMAIGMMASLGFACLVAAHTSGIPLPKATQRIVAVIPDIGGLDYEVQTSTSNEFRETINRWAIKEIKERPLIGEGFKVDFERLYLIENRPDLVLTTDDHPGGVRAAETSSWHNTWLGIPADFGLPALFFWILIWAVFIKKARFLLRVLEKTSAQWVLTATLLLVVMGDILRSWQFGHAAVSYWSISWKMGILFGLEAWLRNPRNHGEEEEKQVAVTNVADI